MKRIGVFLIVVVLLLLFVWFLRHPTPSETGENIPNTVSFKVDKPTESEFVVTTEKSETNQNSAAQVESHDEVIPAEDTDLTWLKIYRMSRELSPCKRVIEGFFSDQDYDPVQRIVDNVQLRQYENSGMPTALQAKLARNHFKRCKTLVNRIETLLDTNDLTKPAENDNSNAKYQWLKEQLAQLLLNTEPITEKEQRLADVLELKINWQTAFEEILLVSEGEDDTNSSEANALRSELEEVNHRMQEIINLTSEEPIDQAHSRQLTKELTGLNLRTHLINAELRNLKQINEPLRAQKIAEFSRLNDALFNHLKTSDADVFFEAQSTLEQSSGKSMNYFGYMPFKNIGKGQLKAPFVEFISPGEVIKDLTGIYDNDLFALVINYATQLYWCDLGGDCGPQNMWIEQYCFNSHGSFNSESCGLDLKTFYQQHLLSANHWEDVQWMQRVIRDLYAH